MNNWTIGKKLITSFLAVAGITLFLGIVGYYGAVKSDEAITTVGHEQLPGLVAILTLSEKAGVIKAAHRTLLSPSLSLADRQRQPVTIAKAKEACEAAWKIYDSFPRGGIEAAAWNEFVPLWKQSQKDSEAFLKMNAELESLGISNPTALSRDLFEVRGTLWKTLFMLASEIKEGVVLSEADTTNSLLADSSADLIRTITTSNPIIQKTLEEIRPLYASLFSDVRKVRETYARGQKPAAREILEKELTPRVMKIIELMRPMRSETDKAIALREKMNLQMMTVAYANETKVKSLLDKLVELNEEETASFSKESIARATQLKSLNLIVTIMGVGLALLLGIFITRSLTKILTQTAESLSLIHI